MSSQGPIVVNTGADGLDASVLWTNPANAGSTSSASVAQAGSVGPSSPTDTLKCQFNAAAFSVPVGNVITAISISFNAWATASPGPIRRKSVKTTLTGSTDVGDLASLTGSDAQYAYGFTGLAVSQASVNGAWEIDLVFDAATNSSSTINVYNVQATVTYGSGGDDFDGNAAQINRSMMISNAVEDWGRR